MSSTLNRLDGLIAGMSLAERIKEAMGEKSPADQSGVKADIAGRQNEKVPCLHPSPADQRANRHGLFAG
jgi:hypothetical protein